ncbi:MAG: PH domain-containing protein [Planctomycetota bacterium]|jgi:membrane protein YdbS with pleckstrin-like domain
MGHDNEPTPEPPQSAREHAPADPGPDGAQLVEAGGDGADTSPSAEEDLWQGRTCWKHFITRIATWFIVAGGLTGIMLWGAGNWTWLSGTVAWIVIIVGSAAGFVAILGGPVLAILGRKYRVTTQRLFIEKGILSQTIDQTELIRVDDVRIYKSFADRIFGLGTVAIISTDSTDRELRIEGIVDPEQVGEAIRGRMRSMRRKSLFVENL